MEKAFDLAALATYLKDGGLDVAEEGVKVVAISLIKWIEESVTVTENKFDDAFIPFLELAKPVILEQVDKIDGKVG